MSQRDRDDSKAWVPGSLPERRDDEAPEHEPVLGSEEEVECLTRIVRDTTMRLEALAAKAMRAVQALEAERTDTLMDVAQVEALADIRLWEDARSIRHDITQALASLMPLDGAAMVVEVDGDELERFRAAVDAAKEALVGLIEYAKIRVAPPDEDMLN